jgi:hypothetical protein
MKNEIRGKKLGMSTMKRVLFTTCYFLLMVKSQKKSVLDQAYFSHLFWLFTMSKKLIFCKKYFLQHVHFLLIVKSHFTPLAFYPE